MSVRGSRVTSASLRIGARTGRPRLAAARLLEAARRSFEFPARLTADAGKADGASSASERRIVTRRRAFKRGGHDFRKLFAAFQDPAIAILTIKCLTRSNRAHSYNGAFLQLSANRHGSTARSTGAPTS
jgi:hypothetical protein